MTLDPAVPAADQVKEVVVKVSDETVGRTISLNVSIKQTSRRVDRLAGVVTAVDRSAEAKQGTPW